MSKTLLFEKDELVKTLNIEELSLTLTAEDIGGRKRKTAPISHYKFINEMSKMINEEKLKLIPNEVIISKKGLKRIKSLDPTDEYVLKSILVQNLISSFDIKSLDNKDMNMKIGIGYNERGITVAFGANIKLCNNMTIMGSQNIINSYGRNKIPFDKFMELIEYNIKKLNDKWNFYNETIPLLKGNIADKSSLHNIVGQLEVMAVKGTYLTEENVPFNIGETSAFVKELIKKNSFENENLSYWDIFNIGTDILTHSEANIASKWNVLANFGNFMTKFIEPVDFTNAEILN